MKKLAIGILTVIAAIAMAICVAACKNGGDDKDPARMQEVAGTYYMSYVKIVMDDEKEEVTYTQDNTEYTLTLSADGTGTMSGKYADVPITWVASGNTFKYTIAGQTTNMKIEGNTLKFEVTETTSYNGKAHTVSTTQIYTKAE